MKTELEKSITQASKAKAEIRELTTAHESLNERNERVSAQLNDKEQEARELAQQITEKQTEIKALQIERQSEQNSGKHEISELRLTCERKLT